MTSSENQNNNIQAHTTLSSSVLNRITQENVEQVPRWQFLLSEYTIWIVWGASVLVGAVAFSVMLFVLMHSGFAFVEATHRDTLHFLIEVMPYLWILVFIAMGMFAQYNLRNTKHGYRYTLWQILLSSILFSLIGGIVLHMLGIGYLVDTQAGRNFAFYPALEKMETRIWQAPQSGRLVGRYQVGSEIDSSVIFKDVEGESWTLNTLELNPIDMHNLYSGDKVRVLGIVSSTTKDHFHGCAVFPWAASVKVGFGELRKDREAFLMRMSEHHKKVMENNFENALIKAPTSSLCASHNAVIRLQKNFAQ
jgi:hypothetical protein